MPRLRAVKQVVKEGYRPVLSDAAAGLTHEVEVMDERGRLSTTRRYQPVSVHGGAASSGARA